MKISRAELKDIVKECLVEILSEGIGRSAQVALSVQSERKEHVPAKSRRDVFPSQQYRNVQEHAKNDQLSNMMKKNEFGDLQSLLEDTAKNTFPKQLAADRGQLVERYAPADEIAQAVAESTPDEIFGEETTRKWAELAFAPSPHRK